MAAAGLGVRDGASATRCAVCRLREAALLQAAHIVEDSDPLAAATIVNGIALCAIHHLAYDRNLMGIDPDGVVHIARRRLDEQDGANAQRRPARLSRSPDSSTRGVPTNAPTPERLEVRFDQFTSTA